MIVKLLTFENERRKPDSVYPKEAVIRSMRNKAMELYKEAGVVNPTISVHDDRDYYIDGTVVFAVSWKE